MEVKDNECNVPRSQTNWKLCCFCQQKKNEKLVSPSDKSDKQASKIYEKIEKDIKNCITNNYDLPFNLTPNCLTVEGCEKISLSLNEKSAIYHQTCRDAIGVKFVEAQKKSKEVSNVLQIEIRDRTNWELCFFCQESGSKKDSLTRPYLKEYYHKSYKQIEKDLENCELNGFTVPFNLSTKCLITTNHNDMASSLLANKAVFHKKCRDKIGPERLERFLNAKAKRKMEEDDEGGTSSISPKKTRSSFESSFSRKSRQCVYCLLYDDDPENTEAISKAGDVGNTWKEMAKAAQNWAVYTRLCTAIDNTASDLSYHRSCYTKLYTEARSAERMSNAKVEEENAHFDPFVIAELVAYMNQKDSEIKIVDLKSLYEQRLMQIGSNWCGKTVHSTRFKEHLLEKLEDDWMILKPDHEKSLVFTRNKIAQKVLLEHLTLEEEAQKIVEVGYLLRKYILHPQPPFSGEFSSKILNESVPKQLLTLIRVLLEGADGIEVKEQSKITARVRVALTLSQLVISNSIKDKSEAQNLYQIKERETPFPLYMSLVLHCSGRKKKLIKNFHKVGVSVSHERTISIRKKIAQAVSARFHEQKVVVPLNCKRGVFTVGTTDNIDVSGRQDMHGTSITLIGQRTKENLGTDGPALNLEISDDTLIELPKEFSNVEFVEDVGEISNLQPVSNGSVSIIRKAWDSEVTEAWLAHVMTIFKKGREEKGWQLEELPVTFSGYFSKKQSEELVRPRAIVGTFPVFSEEKADSISMQRHAMKVVKDSIGYLNGNQTPVIEGDLPLFAQQKKCQWLFKDELGEDKMVCMMGFLHLEMCIQEVGGKLLGGSGWERIFVLAKTYKSGVAASLLGGHKIKRTRQAYMVTLGWLNILRNNAYSTYCKASDCNDSIELWEERLFLSSPTACYWGKIIWRFLMIYCQFIHSQRIGDWTRCLEAIDDICPYFFAFGHTNYARWTPVFLRDMAQLPIRHPDVYKNFMNGNFVVQRS